MTLCFPLTQECSLCIYYSFCWLKTKRRGNYPAEKRNVKGYIVHELNTCTQKTYKGQKYKPSGGVSIQRDQWEDSLNCKAWLCTGEHNTGSDSTHTATKFQAS